jgi:SAM-dependent methyltransferase
MSIKQKLKRIKSYVLEHIPLIRYRLAARRMGDKAKRRKQLFRELVDSSGGKKCLQIGVRNAKFAPHWVSVDLYDVSPLIDFHYDIHDLKFPDETFDISVCNAVLEHVQDPLKAISELRRTLKKGGLIWIEVPFNQPYHAAPHDYWRVTTHGMRIWMKDFEEIESGFFTLGRSSINNAIYFYGRK